MSGFAVEFLQSCGDPGRFGDNGSEKGIDFTLLKGLKIGPHNSFGNNSLICFGKTDSRIPP